MLSMRVYELPETHYTSTWSLFAQAWFDQSTIRAVLELNQSGHVFVDDPEKPTAALLCHPYEFYVVGEVSTPLRQFIKDNPAEPKVFEGLYGYCAAGSDWENAILSDHAGKLLRIPR